MKTFLLILLCTFLLLAGCAEKPGSVGSDIDPNDRIAVRSTSFTSVSDTSYRVAFVPGFSESNLIGKNSFLDEAIAMFQFIPSVSDSVHFKEFDSIITAELRLTPNYRYRLAPGTVGIEVRQIMQRWAQNTFTADSVTPSTFGRIIRTDTTSFTIASTVRIPIDSATIGMWHRYHSKKDTLTPFYGFSVHTAGGAVNGIAGVVPFGFSTSFSPALFISYMNNGVADTVTFTSGEDTYTTKPATGTPITAITLQGAFGIRSRITFDIESLKETAVINGDSVKVPPIVNFARLTLTLDTAASLFGGYSPDSVTAMISLSASVIDSSSLTLLSYGSRIADTTTAYPVYSFPVTTLVQRWINGINPNYGLNLRWSAEVGTAEKAVFFTRNDPDPAKRPKLSVIYSKK